jgi:hypothetical protein
MAGAAAAVCLACACAGRPVPLDSAEAELRRSELASALAQLAADAEPEESRRLAEAALRESHALAHAYRMTRPPQLHNVLVNTGLRERGLCWHWTQDLLAQLRSLRLPHYQLHWAVAHRGELFREHNSVVVTARGADLATGLVLDPWRRAGTLTWVAVTDDSYPWEPQRPAPEDASARPPSVEFR